MGRGIINRIYNWSEFVKKDIIIRYTSHSNGVIKWLEEVIEKEMKKKKYYFIGSGFRLDTAERDLQFRKHD